MICCEVELISLWHAIINSLYMVQLYSNAGMGTSTSCFSYFFLEKPSLKEPLEYTVVSAVN